MVATCRTPPELDRVKMIPAAIDLANHLLIRGPAAGEIEIDDRPGRRIAVDGPWSGELDHDVRAGGLVTHSAMAPSLCIGEAPAPIRILDHNPWIARAGSVSSSEPRLRREAGMYGRTMTRRSTGRPRRFAARSRSAP